ALPISTIPMTLIILRSQVKNEVRLGTLLGLVAAINGGVAGVDVLVSGWMAENWGLRSVVWLIAIVGFIAVAMVAIWAAESKPSRGIKVDWCGALFLVTSVCASTYAVNEAGKDSNANWIVVIIGLVIGLAVMAGFWKWENKLDQPPVALKYL